jgi:hypothetical protein
MQINDSDVIRTMATDAWECKHAERVLHDHSNTAMKSLLEASFESTYPIHARQLYCRLFLIDVVPRVLNSVDYDFILGGQLYRPLNHDFRVNVFMGDHLLVTLLIPEGSTEARFERDAVIVTNM